MKPIALLQLALLLAAAAAASVAQVATQVATPPPKSPPQLRAAARNTRFTPLVAPSRLLPVVPLIFGGTEAAPDLSRRTARLSVCFGPACGFTCTASILNRRTLVTAAHCVFTDGAFADSVTVINGGRDYAVAALHVHAGYVRHQRDDAPFRDDVAVLRLRGGRGRLPGPGRDIRFVLTKRAKQQPRPLQGVQVAGHGLTTAGGEPSPVLMRGTATRLPDEECRGYEKVGFLCTDTMRAAGVLCPGDSGGPMFRKIGDVYRLHGVNSGVLVDTFDDSGVQQFTCGDENTSHIYADVTQYFRAIKSCFRRCDSSWETKWL